MTLPSRNHRDLLVTALALVALLCWDAIGLDLPVARLFASTQGFALRDNWWTSTLLHEGGRLAAWVTLAAVMRALWRAPAPQQPSRAQRGAWMAVMLLCILAVPAIKRFSPTSCPWDLAEFGGVAAYVSHWRLGLADGGPGRCFPSGHAVAAFGFFGMYFLWRDHSALRARAWLAAVLVALATTTPDAMTDEISARADDYDFLNGAAALTKRPLLVLSSDDGLAPMTDALVTAVRQAGGKQVTAIHVATDHGWSDRRIRLQTEILNWLAKLK